MARKRKQKIDELREQLQSVPGVGVDGDGEKHQFTFNTGPAGITGETYWAVCSRSGRRVTVLKRAGVNDHPVFKNRRIAERVVADLEQMRLKNNEFPEVDQFVVAKLEVGKASKIIRPGAGN